MNKFRTIQNICRCYLHLRSVKPRKTFALCNIVQQNYNPPPLQFLYEKANNTKDRIKMYNLIWAFGASVVLCDFRQKNKETRFFRAIQFGVVDEVKR